MVLGATGLLLSCSVFDAGMRRDPQAMNDGGPRVTPQPDAGRTESGVAPEAAVEPPEPCDDIDTVKRCKLPASSCDLPPDGSGDNGIRRCVPAATGPALAFTRCECLFDRLFSDIADCQTIACPSATPYLVGCTLLMGNGETEACVTRRPGEIHVREGLDCSAGVIDGHLFCAQSPPTTPLDRLNCPTDRMDTRYVDTAADCP
jgi:hypothetical protein